MVRPVLSNWHQMQRIKDIPDDDPIWRENLPCWQNICAVSIHASSPTACALLQDGFDRLRRRLVSHIAVHFGIGIRKQKTHLAPVTRLRKLGDPMVFTATFLLSTSERYPEAARQSKFIHLDL